jgi:hypothetical protein
MAILDAINDLCTALFYFERRIDPFYRGAFDRLFQRPLVSAAQALINARRTDDQLGLAEERVQPDEAAIAGQITELMAAFLRSHYPHGHVQRAGNTKTYGVVRGEFRVLPHLPANLRQGVFATPRTYRAWVRFGGPGPLAPPDLKDAGVLSGGIKLMGVDGDKLMDDEMQTQDFTGISAPTFTTPNVYENLKLQKWIGRGTPIFYFINPLDSHFLDAIMQGLYAKTQTSPLEVRYWSCVPYLLGKGQAVQYSLRPASPRKSRVPLFPSDNYLREAMAKTLARRDVLFDFMVQVQTDPQRMPIENAAVEWPEKLSPYVPVARLRLPRQAFDSPAQLAFADNLSFNPWHSLPAHRPLGNQNRARRHIYLELSKLRQTMSGEARIEPTGDETFPADISSA